ncbi:hypothetical protein GCM10012290_19840 [Halolactibacillus alkaliphilus]|uniref:Uncharacterized protein n=1 Tax=Halolactibacillus alkaliphilus TaxID=442899 RepID=A0A511X373_9BACI|nr:hypothetical protein [Halolactibacillus alkaliphilus]GEN57382.1 hypothetical protein HAL01_18460 [Halolactibacillus alkaliphilus]GGN73233.1 hypothetical protein GCM10012290_19840 [Halolactibacillus alkaliphilus]SFO93927.1 hypothetical protein SAMN05720591_1248 [Halolactibacillus alkaliphilus]
MHQLPEDSYHILLEYIFLSFTIDVLESELQILCQSTDIKLQETFIAFINHTSSIAKYRRHLLKKEIKRKQLSVQLLEKNEVFTSFMLILDNKEEHRDFFNPAIRKKIEFQLIAMKKFMPYKFLDICAKPELQLKRQKYR